MSVVLTSSICLFPAVAPSTASAADSVSVLTYRLNSAVTGTDRQFSFVHITDLHVGEGVDDYGTPGYDDSPPAGDVGAPAVALRNSVNWVNANCQKSKIKFVIITGDITDSAEKSEFLKAKEILDSLSVPYVPMLGNHDVWPYTASAGTQFPVGDRYFSEVFGSEFDKLKDLLPGWDDGTRSTPIWNGEADSASGADAGCVSYFQNFAFDYAGYHFICSDFTTRNFAINGKGSMPEGDLFDSSKCQGTWPWFKRHFNAYPHKASKNMLMFSHQPFFPVPIVNFDSTEYGTITGFLGSGDNGDFSGVCVGGHIHLDYKYYILDSGTEVCPAFWTGANKDGTGHLRVVDAWGKKANNYSWLVIVPGVSLFALLTVLFIERRRRKRITANCRETVDGPAST